MLCNHFFQHANNEDIENIQIRLRWVGQGLRLSNDPSVIVPSLVNLKKVLEDWSGNLFFDIINWPDWLKRTLIRHL